MLSKSHERKKDENEGGRFASPGNNLEGGGRGGSRPR